MDDGHRADLQPTTAERDVACERAILALRAFADLCSSRGEIHAAQMTYHLGVELNKLRRPEVMAAIDEERLARARLVA